MRAHTSLQSIIIRAGAGVSARFRSPRAQEAERALPSLLAHVQNGCAHCVWDQYADALQAWREETERLQAIQRSGQGQQTSPALDVSSEDEAKKMTEPQR